MEKEPQYQIEGVDDKQLKKKNEKKKKKKKHENEEERIGLQKCSLGNITKNGVEKEWSSSISLLLLGGVRQQTSSFSLFFVFFFFTSFWNCSTMNTSYYLSFILTIHRFFCFCFLHFLFGGICW